jgi:hypothetical protein
MDDLSVTLKEARLAKKQTIKEVSEKTGISKYCIYTLENGKHANAPPPERLKKLASHYELDKGSLFGLAGYGDDKVGDGELRDLMVQANGLRTQLSNRYSYGSSSAGNGPTTDQILDYPDTIEYSDYKQRYKRQDIANRVVSAPVDATWSKDPYVSETAAAVTAFEKGYKEFEESTRLYYHLRKVDLLASLGRFSVLFIGFEDSAENVSYPPENIVGVNYLSAIAEDAVQISLWDTDPKSKRFGLPTMYQIQFNAGDSQTSTIFVYWSRVLHVAENTLESEVYGIPFLEPIYNRLIGLDKLCGGSPEMYWRGARPGYTAQAQPDSIINQTQLNSIKQELTNYINDMQRFLFVEGVEIKALAPQVVSPKDHVDVQIQMIAGATGMPIRMLTGSERGELASSQDERAWLKLIEQRREAVAKDVILIPLIDRLIALDAIPAPKDGYTVVWDPLVVLEEKDKAEIGRLRTEALAQYVGTPGTDSVVPQDLFLKRELSYSDEEIELAKELVVDKDEDVVEEGELDEVQEV